MDTRNLDMYPTKDDALAAGVPEEHLSEMTPLEEKVWRATTGPFKGRIYRKNAAGQMQRDKQAEREAKNAVKAEPAPLSAGS